MILEFHTKVLGKKAARRLRKLKGEFLTFRSKLPEEMAFDVYLDNRNLGRANIEDLYKEKLNFGSLGLHHALAGGFDTIKEQQRALKRAGYRFKPLGQYEAYPVFFIGFFGEHNE